MSPYHLAYFLLAGVILLAAMMVWHAPPQDSRTMLGAMLAGLITVLIKVAEIIERMHERRGEITRRPRRRRAPPKQKGPPAPK